MLFSMDLIGPELARRFRAPRRSVTFYTTLVVSVLFGGGAGIWLALYHSSKSGWPIDGISAALLTYFPALVASSLIAFTQERELYLRSFGLLASSGFVVLFIFGAITAKGWQFSWALVGVVLSIAFWWVANGLNPCFNDVKAEDAVGGNTSGTLLKSDEEGWKT